MLTNSQKEHLTYTAIGQVFTLVMLGLFIYQYILPGMDELETTKLNAQSSIDTYKDTQENGISFANLGSMLQGKPERAELIKIIQSDSRSAEQIIKKPASGEKNYIDWLKDEIGNSDEDRSILKLEKAKLNSIIPTMSPLSNNIEEDNMTLRQYVKFIENSILKGFNFDSNVVIGMQGVVFGDKSKSMPENLGSFQFRLDFKATNKDIRSFIEYVNAAGKPDILSFTGILSTNQLPSVMSNPLITMEEFSLQDKLDARSPNKQNSGRATLRFYVRGISKDDLAYLKENLKARQDALRNKIDENVKQCAKDAILCASYNKKLTAFQQKYLEYERTMSATKLILTGNEEIYGITQNVNTLKSLEKEFELILPKKTK